MEDIIHSIWYRKLCIKRKLRIEHFIDNCTMCETTVWILRVSLACHTIPFTVKVVRAIISNEINQIFSKVTSKTEISNKNKITKLITTSGTMGGAIYVALF